jgi:hypothetical protein
VADDVGFEDEGTLVLEQRFAIVPEWIIDAPISDCAFRLYAVLLRYGQTSGQRMPGRALLARRLHKSSKDTVDRALKELVSIGAVVVERRRSGRQNLTNRYHLRSTPPGEKAPAARTPAGARGSRILAATPGGRVRPVSPGPIAAATSGRTPAATPAPIAAAPPGRIFAATLAASVRPNPEVPTESNTPPPGGSPTADINGPRQLSGGPTTSAEDRRSLLELCGIDDLEVLAGRCQRLRLELGQHATLWSADRLVDVLTEAVSRRQWPAHLAAAALARVAADPTTRSPMRLACPGPWWDQASSAEPAGRHDDRGCELDRLEARLLEADGRRVWAQQRARADLSERGEALTRLNVARRACELLDDAELTAC